MGIKDRIRRLEDRSQPPGVPHDPRRARIFEHLFHAIENGRRELHGLEPLPDLPYTEMDRENDRRFLEEGIPAYREGPGWQTEEARAVLDYWQQQTEERLQEGA